MANEQNHEGLETFFAAASKAPTPRDDLVARVLADAAQIQAAQATASVDRTPRPRFLQAIGGWAAISGLAAACVAGIAIGVALPSAVGAGFDGTLSSLLDGQDAVGFTGFDAAAFVEGGVGE